MHCIQGKMRVQDRDADNKEGLRSTWRKRELGRIKVIGKSSVKETS